MQQEQYIHVNEYGNKLYYKDEEMTILHREDGPAVEYASGYKSWYLNGKRHRLDGPAVEGANGSKLWYRNGKLFTEEQFKEKINPVTELTLEDIATKLGFAVDKLKIKK